MSERRRGQAGFTLVEVLVALALMGMAAALLLQTLGMAGIVALRERRATAGLEQIVAAQRVLRATIERLRPIARFDSAQPIVDLRGSGGVFTFIAPPLDRGAPDALQRFRLTRTATGELVLYSASTRKAELDRSGTDLVGWVPTSLIDGVSNLSVAYLGRPETGGARIWQERWWDRDRPPELVRVRIEFTRGDRRIWPDLIIRPRATTLSSCVRDGNGRCGESL